MKNKNVGFLITGIAIVIFIIIWIFNQGLTNLFSQTCSHGSSCGMYSALRFQTYLSITIAGIILFIGIFLIFSKEEKEVIIKKIKPLASIEPKKFDKKSLENLDEEEKKIMNLLLENNNSLYQSEIVTKTEWNKVKVTRILDSLESQGFIERKRRGMTNMVMIKTSN